MNIEHDRVEEDSKCAICKQPFLFGTSLCTECEQQLCDNCLVEHPCFRGETDGENQDYKRVGNQEEEKEEDERETENRR